MSIQRDRTYITFECDGCGDQYATMENDFRDALDKIKSEDWQVRRIGSEWMHVCPDCIEAEIV